MEFVRKFEKLSMSDVDIAGGKGASLGEMTQANIPVPPGYVILTDAFEHFLKDQDLSQEIQAELEKVDHEEMSSVERASEHIRALILNAEIPQDIAGKINESFKKMGVEFVAVRSSATAEDGTNASWAGELDTFLNTTRETLLENVKKCWASLFTPRAIFYRFEKGFNTSRVSVAVAVQKMVQSDVSGIAFSVHPVTQDKNQLIIEAGWGLGEAIVSGSITPDGYVVDKRDLSLVDVNIANQERGIFGKPGGDSDWEDIPKHKREMQKLDGEKIIELSKMIINIEKHYGFPCDIEWAMEKGILYITQSRPITTLK